MRHRGPAAAAPANAAPTTPGIRYAHSADDSVAYGEQNQQVTMFDTPTTPPSWGLDRVDQRALPLDAIYRGSGTSAGVIAGVDWVTAHAVEPAVANMSLGGGADSSLDAAVQASIASGVTALACR